MAKLLSIIVLVFFLVNPGIPEKTEDKPTSNNAKIQLALILDTSNSMDGLIDQAKSQIWKIVNEMAISKMDGKNPDLELALYAYGNDNFNATNGYIEIQSALSQDLDIISDKLFRLTTKGGSEYCGQVIHTALTDLDWSSNEKVFKLIVIAGNEPFDQGPIVPNDAYNLACEKGIAITTIFCGDWKEGIATGWKDAPACVAKKYLNIDQDEAVAHIPTPFDDEIIALNSRLNDTYLAYGQEGTQRMELQKRQDINANAYGSANLRERASFKSKAVYNNAQWDLVDAAEEEPEILNEIKRDALPKEMQSMSDVERKEYLMKKKQERDDIKSQMRALEEKANQYVAEKKKEKAKENTLDEAMMDAIKTLASDKGLSWD
jgi:hypothetical protein